MGSFAKRLADFLSTHRRTGSTTALVRAVLPEVGQLGLIVTHKGSHAMQVNNHPAATERRPAGAPIALSVQDLHVTRGQELGPVVVDNPVIIRLCHEALAWESLARKLSDDLGLDADRMVMLQPIDPDSVRWSTEGGEPEGWDDELYDD